MSVQAVLCLGSRTLVNGIFTAVLAGNVEMSFVVFQHVLLVLAHVEDSEVAYFATAMLMAALFEPLRRRMGAYVERRFFRRSD
jgi:hypothetical protein